MSNKKIIQVPDFFPNKKVMLEPSKMKIDELLRYQSLDEQKIASSIKNYKAAVPYMLGLAAGMLVCKFVADSMVRNAIFGENNNGGSMLNMYTKNTPNDMAYNREFQRMRWLTEDPIRNDPFKNTSTQLLTDLGAQPINYGLNVEGVKKKAPHFKYL